jgi:nucleotide-binding universal stress UspA family protein
MTTDTLRILLATDGSPESGAAVEALQFLPLPAGTVIHVLSVMHAAAAAAHAPRTGALTELLAFEEESCADACKTAAEVLRRDGITVTTDVRKGSPAQEILDAAREMSAALIVLGAKGRGGLPGRLLGSTTLAVAHRTPIPVLVARPLGHPLRTVVIASDGSAPSLRAARLVAEAPLPENVEVIITHVLPPYQAEPSLLEYGPSAFDATLEELRREAERAGTALLSARVEEQPPGRRVRTALRVGEPAGEILDLAREVRAELIVAGARKVSFAENLLIGSVADRLLREAPCSVLLVP